MQKVGKIGFDLVMRNIVISPINHVGMFLKCEDMLGY